MTNNEEPRYRPTTDENGVPAILDTETGQLIATYRNRQAMFDHCDEMNGFTDRW